MAVSHLNLIYNKIFNSGKLKFQYRGGNRLTFIYYNTLQNPKVMKATLTQHILLLQIYDKSNTLPIKRIVYIADTQRR